MSGSILAVLYLALLVTAVQPSAATAEAAPRGRRPVATVCALVVVGVPTLVQLLAAPALLGALERDRAAIAAGQVWRLLTSLVVQDGGWAGAVFNLAALALVGAVAEGVWGWRRWLVVALVSGLGAELWGLVVQPLGGGNSIVNFGLAASLAVRSVQRAGRERALATVSLLLAAALLVTGDIHGGAAAIGAVTGLLLLRTERG